MITLYLQAPFAACRTFTAGWYRPTATFLTPSAAYGLILNVAGIESRLREEDPGHDGRTPASLMRLGLPNTRLALGMPEQVGDFAFPSVQTIYQQLHNYPVGAAGRERAESAKGNKYNITPVRREFLADLRALICLDGNPDLENRVRHGLRGEFNSTRYGIPFLGDNQFLVDRLEERSTIPRALWYEQISDVSGSPRPRTTRLTIWIDRADLSRTVSSLYAPTESATADVPPNAWTVIPPSAT
jgi:CRISPR-associated protein Cas5t